MSIYLGVNIDHIATLREARKTSYPSPVEAALICEQAGADSITLHLREDRRHIQDLDVELIRESITTKMNLEFAATNEMLKIVERIKPEDCCLVPEKRQELTTEGGVDVIAQKSKITEVCQRLSEKNIRVSLFIEPNKKQIDAAKDCGAKVIELHTGLYAQAKDEESINHHFKRIKKAAYYANSIGLQVNAGHGLTLENTPKIAALEEMVELNIGHYIISRALFLGLAGATREMKDVILNARK